MGGSQSKSLKEVVEILVNSELPSKSDDLWDNLWTMDTSPALINEHITPAVARKLITKQPGNTKKLFKLSIAQLSQVIETPYPVYFPQALNCVRILTRLLPFMLEGESKLEYLHDLLWNIQVAKKVRRLSFTKNSDELTAPIKTDTAKVQVVHKAQPLGQVLLYCTFSLCFLPEFTIGAVGRDFSVEEMESRAFKATIMWSHGVGSLEKAVTSSSHYDRNRIEALRLLLAGSCGDVFHSYDSFLTASNPWLKMACSNEAPYAEALFFSLMNTVLGYDPVGWGLPFSSYISKDTVKELMESSIDVLLVFLNYGISSAECCEAFDVKGHLRSVDGVEGYNIHRFLLAGIRRNDEFNFICKGFMRLFQYLKNYRNSSSSLYLFETKLVVLLWKLLDENSDFLEYYVDQSTSSDLWVVILEITLERRCSKPIFP